MAPNGWGKRGFSCVGIGTLFSSLLILLLAAPLASAKSLDSSTLPLPSYATIGLNRDLSCDPRLSEPYLYDAQASGAISEMHWLFYETPEQRRPDGEHLLVKGLVASSLYQDGNEVEVLARPRSAVYSTVLRRPLLKGGPDGIELPEGAIAVDLHVHTRYSHDSFAGVRNVLLAAARRGLAGLAITDHDTLEGAEEATRVAAQMMADKELPPGFFVIKGEEVSSLQGHILGLFLEQEISAGRSAAETVEAIHRAGGLAIAAHPCLSDGVGKLATALPFDAVERANGAEEMAYASAFAYERHRREGFYAKLTGPQTGGSDAHDPQSVGACYTIVECAPTLEAVREALRAGRVQPGFGAARMPTGGPAGLLLSLHSEADLISGQAATWLVRRTHVEAARVALFPAPGISLTKEF